MMMDGDEEEAEEAEEEEDGESGEFEEFEESGEVGGEEDDALSSENALDSDDAESVTELLLAVT